jgi:hypothetical protein
MIGVFHAFPSLGELKRNYLFFDELQTSAAFLQSNLHQLTSYAGNRGRIEALTDFQREMDYLFESGIIQPNEDIESRILPDYGSFNNESIALLFNRKVKIDPALKQFYNNVKSIQKIFGIEIKGQQEHMSILATEWNEGTKFALEKFLSGRSSIEEIVYFINTFSNLYSRYATILLNKKFEDKRYAPLLTTDKSLRKIILERLNYVDNSETDWYGLPNDNNLSQLVKIVINKLPVPDDTTSWETLKDFKNDRQAHGAAMRLHNWMFKIVRSDLKIYEVEAELEDLLFTYEEQLRVHKVKYKAGVLESLVVPTMDFFEDLAKLKPGKATKGLFELHKNQFYALEAEMKLPGREVAYIQRANDFFRKRK